MATIQELAEAMEKGERVYCRDCGWLDIGTISKSWVRSPNHSHHVIGILQTRVQYEAEEARKKAEAEKPKPGEVWGSFPEHPWFIGQDEHSEPSITAMFGGCATYPMSKFPTTGTPLRKLADSPEAYFRKQFEAERRAKKVSDDINKTVTGLLRPVPTLSSLIFGVDLSPEAKKEWSETFTRAEVVRICRHAAVIASGHTVNHASHPTFEGSSLDYWDETPRYAIDAFLAERAAKAAKESVQ